MDAIVSIIGIQQSFKKAALLINRGMAKIVRDLRPRPLARSRQSGSSVP
jgi:hypothetical protein